MSKVKIKMRIKILIYLVFLFLNSVYSQCLLIETNIETLTKKSELIIEGRVLSSFSTWNKEQNFIYTLHEVEVYGKFKGEKSEKIYIATQGGVVGDRMLKVNPELELEAGHLGIFFLNETKTLDFLNLGVKIYVPSYNAQSFFKYDELSNAVNGVFKNYVLDAKELDREIESFTNEGYVKIKKLKLDIQSNQGLNSRMITSFSPTIITAGTFASLTITGSGFGTVKGSVRFTNATGGPGSYTRVYQQDITSWSNTQIVVKVPTFAGTGLIWVRTSSGTDYLSSTMLTIKYAETTANQQNDSIQFQTRLSSKNTNLGQNTFTFNTTLFNTTGAYQSFKRAMRTLVCKSNVNWNLATSSTSNNAPSGSDNINLIFFDSSLTGGVIGKAYSWFSSCQPIQNWYCVDLDLGFDPNTNWHYLTSNPPSNQIDFESVALHELGHLHQLGHVIDESKVMHRSISNGATRRTLSGDEVEALLDIYSRSVVQGNCTGNNFNPMNYAPNVSVTNNTDTGPGSLREAILDVCENDTIVMSLPASSTIELSSAELTIGRSMKIHGLSQTTFNLSGKNERRIFNIQTGKTLSLQNLKLINSFSTSNGGAIYNNGILNLKNVTFQNNFQNGVRKAFTSPTGTTVSAESSVIINN